MPHLLYRVPFYGNLPDDKHCAQATLRSALEYFEPNKPRSWEELEIATNKLPGKGVWRMSSLLWLQTQGYKVQDISTMDYQAFAEHGLDYLAKHYSPEAAAWEADNFDIPAERSIARTFATTGIPLRRVPTQRDIVQLLTHGYLVQLTVNIARLNHLNEIYRGHAILVIGYDNTGFIVHDPGLPPRPYRRLTAAELDAAWGNPNPQAKVITALRLPAA